MSMIELTDTTIDPQRLLDHVHDVRAGAVVLFLGTTREVTGERRTESLDYECYPDMARAQLAELVRDAQTRWTILHCAIVHRMGHLLPGEASVAVAVSTPHRKDGFEAAQWLMDRLKELVPIWKRENWADGTSEWIHHG